MKKTTIIIIGILLISTVFAQSHKGGKNMGKPRMERRTPLQHGEIGNPKHSERMEKMMAFKLTEDLDLTSEQAEKFFPMLKEHREIMDKIDSEIFEVTKDFQDDVKDGKKLSDKKIDEIFDKVHSLERKKIDEKARYHKSLKGVLENSQRVKLMTFKHRFARGVEDRLRLKRKELNREKERLERKLEELEEHREKLNNLEMN
jgi:hypothetical protein